MPRYPVSVVAGLIFVILIAITVSSSPPTGSLLEKVIAFLFVGQGGWQFCNCRLRKCRKNQC